MNSVDISINYQSVISIIYTVEGKQLLDWATINIEILVKLLISALYWATLIFLLPLIRGLFTHFFLPNM